MKQARRWVYGKTYYDDHYEFALVLDEARYHSDDMDAIVACAQCGKPVRYVDTYSSKEIQSDGAAWGYAVCEDCHRAELERQFAADRRGDA